jgi:hypothetical protein
VPTGRTRSLSASGSSTRAANVLMGAYEFESEAGSIS